MNIHYLKSEEKAEVKKEEISWAPASGQHCGWVFTRDPVESLWECWTVDPYFHPHFVDKKTGLQKVRDFLCREERLG